MRFIDFPTHSDERGNLAVIEGVDFPFEVKRVFYIYGVPHGAVRGVHAHRQCQQVLIAIAGRFTVTADGNLFHLTSPNRGLCLPPLTWRYLHEFSPDAICLVLCSHPYSKEDYIYDIEEYYKRLKDDPSHLHPQR